MGPRLQLNSCDLRPLKNARNCGGARAHNQAMAVETPMQPWEALPCTCPLPKTRVRGASGGYRPRTHPHHTRPTRPMNPWRVGWWCSSRGGGEGGECTAPSDQGRLDKQFICEHRGVLGAQPRSMGPADLLGLQGRARRRSHRRRPLQAWTKCRYAEQVWRGGGGLPKTLVPLC